MDQTIQEQEIILMGFPISRGIAIGYPFFLNIGERSISERLINHSNVDQEIERYRGAVSKSVQDIKNLQTQLKTESATEGVLILEAQLEMLHDPMMTTAIEDTIRHSHKNAEFVFQQTVSEFKHRFQSLSDSFFEERFKDLQDLARRLLDYLEDTYHQSTTFIPPHSIVCSIELSASDVAGAKIYCVEGFLTEMGGPTSHAGIVAKSKGIPYMTNVNLNMIKERGAELIIMDGRTGKIILNPNQKTLKRYELLKSKILRQIQDLELVSKWPSQTFDGFNIRLTANLESIQEIDLIHRFGGEGIGLFRSEYLWLTKNQMPSEEEQYLVYQHLTERLGHLPVTIRTFDLGGDKKPVQTLSEHYPFISNGRAMRFLLKEKEILKTQIRAILRASVGGNVGILFPMIASLSELREAKQLIKEIEVEMDSKVAVRIGCMIEVPSSAISVDYFVQECDFLSIGTNDLIQFALAIDRQDQHHQEAHVPTDPSVLRLIKQITFEADRAHVPVSVCGEMASDPRFTPLLLGLGVQELSVAPRHLPVIKNAIRSASLLQSVHLAEKVLQMRTAQEVLNILSEEYRKNVPHDLFYNTHQGELIE